MGQGQATERTEGQGTVEGAQWDEKGFQSCGWKREEVVVQVV